MKVFLTGPMGAGKTTVGRLLAQRLHLRHYDLDQVLEKRYRRSVHELFEERGERWFRGQERRVLREFLHRSKGVFSLGGGSLRSQAQVKRVKRSGDLVYLQVSAREALRRTKKNSKERPLRANLRELLKKREYLYGMAHFTIRTTAQTPRALVSQILARLSS